MFDIRKMHAINNREGGQAEGDRAIAMVGKFLRNTFRMDEGDIVARTGGDEFSVVAPYFLVDADGKSHTPSDIKEILWGRLTSNWLKLKEEGAVNFDLLVHGAPVEQAKSREDTRRDADPKNHWGQAMVFSDTIEPYPEVEKREDQQNHQPKRENYFERIFKRRTHIH
jgi:GGDEF domain-containing protein